jgi:hypothetical protein
VTVLLTGVPGLKVAGNVRPDLLRVKTAIAPDGSGDPLGALAGDFQGLPERSAARRRRRGPRDRLRLRPDAARSAARGSRYFASDKPTIRIEVRVDHPGKDALDRNCLKRFQRSSTK